MSKAITFRGSLFIIALVVLLPIGGYFAWWSLPVTINRRSDINYGNQLIGKIEAYEKDRGLPKTGDWQTLKQLGFKQKGDFLFPDYHKINDSTFGLIYLEGFDGPYLLWYSNEREWKIAMPIYFK